MPDQPADPIPTAPASLSRAETIGLGNATCGQLHQVIEELRQTLDRERRNSENERAIAMCQAYEQGVLDERAGLLPQPCAA